MVQSYMEILFEEMRGKVDADAADFAAQRADTEVHRGDLARE
jgi:formate dehydrogenase maturation protein FdhE